MREVAELGAGRGPGHCLPSLLRRGVCGLHKLRGWLGSYGDGCCPSAVIHGRLQLARLGPDP